MYASIPVTSPEEDLSYLPETVSSGFYGSFFS
jgi:hypothetical protein